MDRVKITGDELQIMALLEKATGARVKDCVLNEQQALFIVETGDAAKAIGPGGRNAKFLEQKLKRRVRLVEYHPNLLAFVTNLVAPARLRDARENDGVVTLYPADSMTRGTLIGRGGSNLRTLESVVQRYFPVKEIKVE